MNQKEVFQSKSEPKPSPSSHSADLNVSSTSLSRLVMIGASFIAVVLALVVSAQTQFEKNGSIPQQAVIVEPQSFAVLGTGGSFRQDAFSEYFNPTNTSPPFFQVFNREFLSILGGDAFVREIASNETYAFAHEAPIWIEETNEVVFSSNAGGSLGLSGPDQNNAVFKLSLKEAEQALEASNGSVNIKLTKLDIPSEVQMTNGGTGPVGGSLLLTNQGRNELPSNLALVNPNPPYNVTVLLDNFYGRQFNSLNDVKIHPQSGAYIFTDVTYGFLQDFRPTPLLPNQIYRFDPKTSAVRVIADGFDKCNGLAFTSDGKTAYIADTGAAQGFFGLNTTRPATIYAFDVDEKSQAFSNRRIFAFVDAGVPDGIQVDKKGNVYSGCGDGVHVWNSAGDLLGKIFLNTTSSNLAFVGDNRLVILAETKVFLAKLNAEGLDLTA